MADAFAHCETLVREHDKDRYLATLFAPAALRPALFALYAFDVEIGRIGGLVREPFAGEIRLQWWRDALTSAAPDVAAGNPVAEAFREAIARFALPARAIENVIDAHGADFHPEALASVELLEAHCRDAAGGILALAMKILCGDAHEALAGQAGLALGLARFAEEMRGGREHPLLSGGLGRDLDMRALAAIAAAKPMLATAPECTWPALLPLALVRTTLSRSSALPQWRRQWILWRAARNLTRAL